MTMLPPALHGIEVVKVEATLYAGMYSMQNPASPGALLAISAEPQILPYAGTAMAGGSLHLSTIWHQARHGSNYSAVNDPAEGAGDDGRYWGFSSTVSDPLSPAL